MAILDTINGHGDEEQGGDETRSTKKSISSHSTKASTHSRLTSASRKSAAAEVAANEATLQVLLEQEHHIEELQRLEAEAAQLKAKQEAEIAERQRLLEAKRREIERFETIKKLKAAKARQQVYEQSESSRQTSKQSQCSDDVINELLHKSVPVRIKEKVKQELSPTQHHSPPQAVMHPAEDNTTALVRALTESINASRMPVPEPTMFSGDPLRFHDWKVSFQTLIDRKSIPAEEKIYYLRKYVGGSAKKAIESYFLLGTKSAYLAAWCILEERYGSPFLIAKAFRDKIDAWPKISAKGSLELQEFVDFLRSCESAMPQIKSLEVLNDYNENQKILAKLPDWLTSRWNRKVMEVEEESQTFPSFSQFVQFLTREAKIACNPITSLHALKPSEGEKSKVLKNRSPGAKALTTSANEKAHATCCVFCEKVGHGLPECRKFIRKAITEQLKFVQENKLCFGCLKLGHRSKDCGDRNICRLCEKGHPTCLHDNRTKEERMQARTGGARDHDKSREGNADQPQDLAPSTSREATSHRVTQNGRDTHTSTIIPVWVSTMAEPHSEVLVYALLDTQSDTTFILEETAKALNTRSEPVQLRISTLASRNTVVSCQKLTGLQVRGFYSDKIIPLPVTYSREFIPANRNHIPTPETAKVWSHLEHIADEIAPQQSCDIGLLIGYNCPQALVPRQVLPGEDNQPFGQRTDLGWSVVGYGDPCLNFGDAIGVSHQVIVKQVMPGLQSSSDLTGEVHYICRTQIKEVILPADVIKVLESDFAERASETDHVSQEDLRFLSKLKQGIVHKSDGHYEMPLPFKDDRPNLPDNKKELPRGKIKMEEISSSDPELKKVQVHNVYPKETRLLDRLHKFSDWSRIVKAIARLKRHVKEIKGLQPRSCEVTSLEERREAELTIIKMVQEAFFSKETQGKDKFKKLYRLSPFLDGQGILRVGGRLTHAALHPYVKHPVVLPKDCHVSALLIKHHHERVLHQGRGMTMNALRSNGIWILGCSKAVSSHVYKCTTCRKFRRSPEQQRMADLPEDRMETTPPFTYCGMDCFGPFYIKEGRKELKRYGLLLTCMCSRAVHIEMFDDLTTDAFINALCSFIAICGTVRQIRCDQGTNFVGARREFAEALKEEDQEKLKELGCEFIMNTPASSHMGGDWERQIRTIKSVLTSILEQSARQLDCSSLRTFLYEVMAVVNSRPLTTDCLNDSSSPEPLTPNHILTMKSTILAPPPGRFIKEDLYLRKRWRRVQLLANLFWSRWKKEYLLNLQHRQKWTKDRRDARVSDVVLLQEDTTPRNQWKLAKVIEVYPGKDGKVRRLKLLISDSNLDEKGKRVSKPVHLERPVHKTVTLLEAA
ncbi:hypothetical protein SRHO_G00235690 [Serrasalmus rhombeus]